ncbi:MAG: hypothetical protein WAO02_17295 [Verrucomicrobiia bacterium]
MSESRHRELVMAAMTELKMVNSVNAKRSDLPEPIRRLNPIAVYRDYSNLVIVLYRNAHEEGGYYFFPAFSSESPVGKGKGWSFKMSNGSKPDDPGVLFEYRRKL